MANAIAAPEAHQVEPPIRVMLAQQLPSHCWRRGVLSCNKLNVSRLISLIFVFSNSKSCPVRSSSEIYITHELG